jgi:hypothetical protein
MWAPAYFRRNFFPFTGTTGRSESMNSLFKKVIHPQDSVLKFVTQYDYIMDTRAERENKERCKGAISDPHYGGGTLSRSRQRNSTLVKCLVNFKSCYVIQQDSR